MREMAEAPFASLCAVSFAVSFKSEMRDGDGSCGEREASCIA